MLNKIAKKIINYLPMKSLRLEKGVKYSLQKYGKTYKLLEEYDKKADARADKMADPGRLQSIIRDFQRSATTG